MDIGWSGSVENNETIESASRNSGLIGGRLILGPGFCEQ